MLFEVSIFNLMYLYTLKTPSDALLYITTFQDPPQIFNTMKSEIYETIRARRLALGLSQIEVARRSGIQQRQVSLFERGGDVTLSTLLKLAQALDMELLPAPRDDITRLESFLKAKRGPAPSTSSPSLLDRYQVKDDAEPTNG